MIIPDEESGQGSLFYLVPRVQGSLLIRYMVACCTCDCASSSKQEVRDDSEKVTINHWQGSKDSKGKGKVKMETGKYTTLMNDGKRRPIEAMGNCRVKDGVVSFGVHDKVVGALTDAWQGCFLFATGLGAVVLQRSIRSIPNLGFSPCGVQTAQYTTIFSTPPNDLNQRQRC